MSIKNRPQNLKVGYRKQRPQHKFLREPISSDMCSENNFQPPFT